jgi:hypothetical protein
MSTFVMVHVSEHVNLDTKFLQKNNIMCKTCRTNISTGGTTFRKKFQKHPEIESNKDFVLNQFDRKRMRESLGLLVQKPTEKEKSAS